MSINLNKYLLIALLVLSLAITAITRYALSVRADRNRISANLTAASEENSELTLKYGKELNQLVDLNNKYAVKLDSVIAINKIKPKQVAGATIINTVYIDTTSHDAIKEPPVLRHDSSYDIPVSYGDSCWGMKGIITSADPHSALTITEQTATNSHQLLVLRKQFLGFLWYTKKTKYKLLSDCGESDFSVIKFVK